MSDTLLIHRFVCPNCGGTAHADRAINCQACGASMETAEWQVGEIRVNNNE